MRKYNIRNLDDLMTAKVSLKIDANMQEADLKRHTKEYLHQFTLGSLIKKYATPNKLFKADEKFNLSGSLMSVVLPFVMNRTLFSGAGFLTKAAVGLVSGKLGKSISAEHVSAVFNSVKGWLSSKKDKKDKKFIDYGIPPDSETF